MKVLAILFKLIIIVSMIWGIIASILINNLLGILFFILAGFFSLWFSIALEEWSKKNKNDVFM